MKYIDIKTPEELLSYMNDKIRYGYLDKYGKTHIEGELDYFDDWKEKYIIEDNEDVLKTKVGTCFDQTEFERGWFKANGYEFKTIFEMILLDYENPYPMHTFLIYKENGKWCLFEHADFMNRGIKKFDSIDSLIKHQIETYKKFLIEDFKISDKELDNMFLSFYEEPKKNIGVLDFIDNNISIENILKK